MVFGQYVKLKIETGPRWAINNPDQLNTYLSTFNTYMESIGVNAHQPYKALSPSVMTFGLGGGVCYSEPGMAYFNFHLSTSNFSQESNYRRTTATEYGRDFVYRGKYSQFLLESGYTTEQGHVFGGGFGILLNSYRVEVWQVYADGSRSMGTEYYTNSYYTSSQSLLGLSGFFELNLYKEIVKLNFRAVYHWDFINAITSFETSQKFYNWHAVDPLFDSMPLDYGRFVNAVNANNISELSNSENHITTQGLTKFTLIAGLVVEIPTNILNFKRDKK